MSDFDETPAFEEKGASPTVNRVDPCGYYKKLGVNVTASPQDIRRSFLALSQRYHTDKHSSQGREVQEAMNRRFQELQEAYTVLSDDRQRAAYDAAGTLGINRLALVPESHTSRNEIISYIKFLEQKEELKRTAKMLSASSNITVKYNVTPLTHLAGRLLTQPAASTEAEEGHEEMEESEHGASDASEHSAESLSEGADEPDKVEPHQPQVPQAEESGVLNNVSVSMTVKEVEIDGKRMYVFIPGDDVQKKIHDRVVGAQQGGPVGTTQQQQLLSNPALLHALVLWRAVNASVVPRSLVVYHSFQHAINSRIGLKFRTSAHCEDKQTSVHLTTSVEYTPDEVSSYAASVRVTAGGVKSTLSRERALNPFCKLKAKLTAFNGTRFLEKLEIALSHVLSKTSSLDNTLAWGLFDHGFFQSFYTRSMDKSNLVVGSYMSHHRADVSLYYSTKVTYGLDTKDPENPPASGEVAYRMNFFPFSGQTQVGFEAWYRHTALQHFGVSLTTLLPYSPSPLVPLFVVRSETHAVLNQISFLYRRGQHRISVPVVVLISPSVSHAVLWLGAPLCLYRIGQLLYRPYAKARATKLYAQLRREHIAEMDIARANATMEQKALEEMVMQSRALEDRKGGLVIMNARYGVLTPEFAEGSRPASPIASSEGKTAKFFRCGVSSLCGALRRLTRMKETPAPPTVASEDISLTLDVTMALQNLVRDSALTLAEGTKSELVGFCDPDPHTPERKQLKVVYWFRGKKHSVVIDDDEPLELPQREHLLPA